MTKTERHAEWTRQIREIKALGIAQVRLMFAAYFPNRPITSNMSSAWMASAIASSNMANVPKS